MAGYTNNYQLHQWEAGDDFLRTDFNEDFVKIDAALGKLSVEVGSYVGDGTSERTIALGCTPRAVILCTHYPLTSGSGDAVTILTQAFGVGISNDSVTFSPRAALEGNLLRLNHALVNGSGHTSYYLIFQ
ncbi:hypothetical protein [Lawsonibacter celer]|uniref:hypothetical protein n=1 Tax=Lawsonibacter celer TaxID=2986526 RepID=UPI001647F3A8|nr:hypothetical protein [Lawsonibacter celer]